VSKTEKLRVVHDPNCREPLNEHSGDEPCLRVVIEEEKEIPLVNYMQGVQGNMIADFRADYLVRYGSGGEPVRSTVVDTRDLRDPEQIGRAYLARRQADETMLRGQLNSQ
jgi:hypothetical protein